ncbi:YitT family protein [[Collinsella] massiliensis]|uniref:Membrane protein n=1 Tax=[Collinsella] massiliensis TaxID=1232426 RepID=A0A1Y3XTN2_9ACTN|nr:YitT family protein [[Collinsella] massiliensis]OUN88873.1 membrane protein [[Collinsella] massiliensis]
MASRMNLKHVDVKRVIRSRFWRDVPLIAAGCAIAAFAVDAFMVSNGLAAGGLTGLATIIAELASRQGIYLPVGFQTIVMNAVLLLFVMRTGGTRYMVQTITGFVLFGFFCDALMPLAASFESVSGDLVLSALWGGIISGVGYGLVFRAGANTGGSDTIAQIISRKTSLPVGATVMAIDVAVCAASAPVFSLEHALYAALAMVIMGYVVDMVVDGGNRQRAAFIVSDAWKDIKQGIFDELDRGCTELLARGGYTGKERPVILLIMSKNEISLVKTIVHEYDPNAIIMITDVSEAIGYGFKEFTV